MLRLMGNVVFVLQHTYGHTGTRGPGDVMWAAVQQVVALQEAVERAEDGSIEHDGQRDGSTPDQEGIDETPVGKS